MPRDNQDKPARRGRPPWMSSFDTKCDVRLSAKEDKMLNELSRKYDTSRSNIMRKALKDFYKFNTQDGTEV